MPALMDMIMCGCGGNHYAVAVTNKRIIIQNDRRCESCFEAAFLSRTCLLQRGFMC